MGLNIKNPEVEQLASDIASATGVSKTEAIRQALLDRKERLALPSAQERWQKIRNRIEHEVLPLVPLELRGKSISQEEQDEILGYGPDGYCVS